MSSKGAKARKAVDKGDGHWSGVGKGGKFACIYTHVYTLYIHTHIPGYIPFFLCLSDTWFESRIFNSKLIVGILWFLCLREEFSIAN